MIARPIAAALCAGLLAGSIVASAQTASPSPPSPRGSMPVMTGDQWQQLSPNEKVAFVWGVSHVVDFERNARAQGGTSPTQQKSLIPSMERSLQGRTIGNVVGDIDAYYASRPDARNRPVMDTLVVGSR